MQQPIVECVSVDVNCEHIDCQIGIVRNLAKEVERNGNELKWSRDSPDRNDYIAYDCKGIPCRKPGFTL